MLTIAAALRKVRRMRSPDAAGLQDLLADIAAAARSAPFPLDRAAYTAAGREPDAPILCAGSLAAGFCVMGRDLGRQEVLRGEPLCGAAGRHLRRGLFRFHHGRLPADAAELDTVLTRVLLTNTVPFKPPGNKPYGPEVVERFRPFVERLLVCHWQGADLIPLGAGALAWFTPYAPDGAVAALAGDRARFEKSLEVKITARDAAGRERPKAVRLHPLPHPSPLNVRYFKAFPALLAARLAQLGY